MSVNEQEAAFVKRFIVENKQDRYLLFLSKAATRHKFLGELYHRLAFKPSLATEVLPRESITQLEQRLRALGAGRLAYVISPYENLDGQWLELAEVLSEILSNNSEAILCCLPGQLAFYLSETNAYILHYLPHK